MNNNNNTKYLINRYSQAAEIGNKLQIAKKIVSEAEKEASIILEQLNQERDAFIKKANSEGFYTGMAKGISQVLTLPKIKKRILEESADLIHAAIKIILEEMCVAQDISKESLTKRIDEIIQDIQIDTTHQKNIVLYVPEKKLQEAYSVFEERDISISVIATPENKIEIETEDGSIAYIPDTHLRSLLDKIHSLLTHNQTLEEIVEHALLELHQSTPEEKVYASER